MFNKGPESKTIIDPSVKALETVKKDPMLSKAYESWAGRTNKAGEDMQKKFLEAVVAYKGMPMGYNKFDESFVPLQYESFN